MKRILAILLENEPGSLSRIVGLFSQRAYNIDSLTVGTTDDKTLSRITITTHGDDRVVEQITKQVNKLVDVLKVLDLTEVSHVERELLMVKVYARNETTRAAITRVSDVFGGTIIDMGKQSYTIQMTSSSDKIENFLKMLCHESDLIEVVRSGSVGIGRGDKALRN
ncbi:acetolactate synthase small subunit [Pseudoalteromonas luteoviolacea]|uniref:acetolactate synthase small subunit n=1 Tax=Pseudoalteromonas luteoviolacea TaxID=43657 RepID=UPI001151AF2E|nr:acetolactate synthase small subunit [Pseudoalteromonas luteoviolacea]TQF67411.1 acetolactate synthase small subunit [Pseudoalteromonas luteoviolacea]